MKQEEKREKQEELAHKIEEERKKEKLVRENVEYQDQNIDPALRRDFSVCFHHCLFHFSLFMIMVFIIHRKTMLLKHLENDFFMVLKET